MQVVDCYLGLSSGPIFGFKFSGSRLNQVKMPLTSLPLPMAKESAWSSTCDAKEMAQK